MAASLEELPESTAVRVALWRALHLEVDSAPPVLRDDVGLKLVAPEAGWRARPDMHPQGTRGYRASIVGRARLIEDLLAEKHAAGVNQYVILGAGLDSFAQRRPELASRMSVFEVDQPGPQAWKRKRLEALGLGVPSWLELVPVNFEAGESWWERVTLQGFEPQRPAFVASTGVSMYLTREAILATLRQLAALAPGSCLAMTFMLPLELIPERERAQHQMVYERARAAGTPFLSFFRPEEMLRLASEAGFREARHFSTEDMIQRYFRDRPDGLEPSTGESFLIAGT